MQVADLRENAKLLALHQRTSNTDRSLETMAGYVRGRLNIACVDLIDELKELGVSAAVGHSGSAKRGLTVRPHNRNNIDKIPKTFRDMTVTIEFDNESGNT